MTDRDIDYFARRSSEERARANAATDICPRKAHETIAATYERKGKLENPSRPIASAR